MPEIVKKHIHYCGFQVAKNYISILPNISLSFCVPVYYPHENIAIHLDWLVFHALIILVKEKMECKYEYY